MATSVSGENRRSVELDLPVSNGITPHGRLSRGCARQVHRVRPLRACQLVFLHNAAIYDPSWFRQSTIDCSKTPMARWSCWRFPKSDPSAAVKPKVVAI